MCLYEEALKQSDEGFNDAKFYEFLRPQDKNEKKSNQMGWKLVVSTSQASYKDEETHQT